jgi:C-terminal processing protease CtpA/Prc
MFSRDYSNVKSDSHYLLTICYLAARKARCRSAFATGGQREPVISRKKTNLRDGTRGSEVPLFFLWPILLTVLLSGASLRPSNGGDSKFVKLTTAQAQEMLDKIKADIKENYYDAKLRGLDIDKRFEEARQKIAVAKSQDDALLAIAAAVAALKDSHTRFRPPVRPYGVDYGWLMEAVGDSDCYVTGVRPESDAAAKGMKPGDRVVSINGVPIGRADLGIVEYSYYVFPQSGFHLATQSPDGIEKQFVAMAKVIPGQVMISHVDVMAWARANGDKGFHDRSRYHEESKKVLFWKLPDFNIDPVDADHLLNKMHSFETVVLDLRGNPGGIADTANKFLGELFNHDVKVGEFKSRKETKDEIAKTRGGKTFNGKFIVLVDSGSASASEILARVVQLEKRGTVVGDRSAGAVMEAKYFTHAVYLDRVNVTQYGAEISMAELIMADGKSIENVGVTPDERILPTPADIAAGRDPALARAAALAGIELTADQAGRIFPFEWPKDRIEQMN